jgi:hypothetical protein
MKSILHAAINGKHTPAGVPFYSLIEMSVASGLPIYQGGAADIIFNWGGSGFKTPTRALVLNRNPIFGKFRQAEIMFNHGVEVPRPYEDLSDVKKFPVLRKPHDSYGGHDITIIRRYDSQANTSGYWFQDLVNKVAEYRVYFFDGRIPLIEEKMVRDRSKVVWGSEDNAFSWERRADLEKNRKIGSMVLAGAGLVQIDWGAADLLEDENGGFWICEINSRPTCWGGKRPKLKYRKDGYGRYYSDQEPDSTAIMWAKQMKRFIEEHS